MSNTLITNTVTQPARRLYRPTFILLIYLIFLYLAEGLIVLISPLLGIILHSVTLFLLILYASFAESHSERNLAFVLILTPLIRLVSLSLPLNNVPIIYWYLFIGTLLVIAMLIVVQQGHVSLADIGLTKRYLPIQILVGALGILLGYIQYLILRPAPLAQTSDQGMLAAIILLIFTGFLEEIIFRGLIQRALKEALGVPGIFYTAIVFTVLYIGYQSLPNLVFVFLVGVIFGIVANRTGSILGVSLAHGLANIVLYLIFPLMLTTTPVNSPKSVVPEIYALHSKTIASIHVPSTRDWISYELSGL